MLGRVFGQLFSRAAVHLYAADFRRVGQRAAHDELVTRIGSQIRGGAMEGGIARGSGRTSRAGLALRTGVDGSLAGRAIRAVAAGADVIHDLSVVDRDQRSPVRSHRSVRINERALVYEHDHLRIDFGDALLFAVTRALRSEGG